MRGFIDDAAIIDRLTLSSLSQSAFMRGFIDDERPPEPRLRPGPCLNPRSCAASSMTKAVRRYERLERSSLNPRSCAASSMTHVGDG